MPEHNNAPGSPLVWNRSFGFSYVWVIESLRSGDFKTGRQLYNVVLRPAQVQNPGLQVEFIEAHDRIELLEVLAIVKSTLQATGQTPLIHFETHGDQDGIELQSGEYVPYNELCPYFREINILARNNLFIVAAACHGGHLAFSLHGSLTEASPFWGICGAHELIPPGDMITGFSAFYRELLTSVNVNNALSNLNRAVSNDIEFVVWNSEHLFLKAFKYYLREACSQAAIDERTRAILEQARAELGDSLDVPRYDLYIRERLGTEGGQRQSFERMSKKFFMKDLYPEDTNLPDPYFDDMQRITLDETEDQ